MNKPTLNPNLYYGQLLQNKYIHLRLNQSWQLLAPHLKASQKYQVLDIGGYTSNFYQLFIKDDPKLVQKIDYHLIDYDRPALAQAKKHGITAYYADLNQKSIQSVVKNKKFDVIICTEVLEHLVAPHQHLQSINHLIKKTGVCLISLPNENTLVHRIYSLSGRGIDQLAFKPYKHLHFPTIHQSRRLISQYLHIINQDHFIDFNLHTGSLLDHLTTPISKIPPSLLLSLAKTAPNLFARGTIFLCQKK